MENFIHAAVTSLVCTPASCGQMLSCVNWLFWAGIVVGIVGAVVGMFLKPPTDKF